MRLIVLAVLAALSLSMPVRADAIANAFDDAVAAFGRAAPQLSAMEMGVDVIAYRDALTVGQFTSSHWGGVMGLEVSVAENGEGSCSRYAAFVRIPPENGAVRLVLCPKFSTPGADALRRLTILHELVHVVAGPDECRAMAFAARVEWLAYGSYTPVERYWQANGCARSGFKLP